jgi:hypothetical protein
MKYTIIQPPFTLKFREMPKPELKSYFDWFMEMIPERIKILEKAVCDSSEYSSWHADYSPNSLKILGKWFVGQVETRTRTSEELSSLKSGLSFPMDVNNKELTNKTFSLAMDIGMYFSQVVLTNLPGTKWNQILKNVREADYGQPVIAGFGVVFLNPVRILVTLAYGIASKKQDGSRLHELYNTWEKLRK